MTILVLFLKARQVRASVKENVEFKASLNERKKEIADLRALTNRLDETEHRLHMFMKLCPVIMAVSDRERYVEVNKYFCHVTGWSEKELCQMQGWRDFIHPDDRHNSSIAIGNLNGTPIFNLKNRILCKDGSYVTLEWTLSPRSDDGMVYAVARKVEDERCG